MQLGEVRVATESDFDKLLTLALDDSNSSIGTENEAWTLAEKKRSCSIYTKTNLESTFKMIKVLYTEWRSQCSHFM